MVTTTNHPIWNRGTAQPLSTTTSISTTPTGRRHGGSFASWPNVKPSSTTTTTITSTTTSMQAVPVAAAATATTVSTSTLFTTIQRSLHGNPTFVLSTLLLLSTFGITLEQKTTLGKALSAPLATMGLSLIIANVGILPFVSPLYTNVINQYLVPLAVPMLLYDSNLRRVFSDTGSLLLAFVVGAFSTIVGTLIAFPLLPLHALGPNVGWRVACALAARHIGGAINFVAVADTLQISGTVVSAAIAADNIVVAFYFGFLFYISKAGPVTTTTTNNSPETKEDEGEKDISTTTTTTVTATTSEDTGLGGLDSSPITLETLGASITVSSCLVTMGGMLTKWLFPGVSSLPLTSVLTVVAATLFPQFFVHIRTAGSALGILFIQLFFAASGAAGSIPLVLKSAPSLFAFCTLQIGIHFLTLLAVGKGLCKLPSRELYLASNANVGGPTTAAAMAQAKEWHRLVLPALLVGILGYASATAIALALGPILLKLPTLV